MEKSRRVTPAAVLLAGYGVLFALGFVQRIFNFQLEHALDFLPITCPFRFLTGWLCPGCGLTHAFFAMSRFDFAAAVGFHPFSPVIFIGLLGWSVVEVTRRKSSTRRASLSSFTLAIVIAGILVFWLLRNI